MPLRSYESSARKNTSFGQRIELLAVSDSNTITGGKSVFTFHMGLSGNNLTEPRRSIPDIRKRLSRKYLSGWRLGVIYCILLGVSIFLCNLSITAWALAKLQFVQGVATVYQGSYTRTKSTLVWLHLAINVLSGLLLAASNYCMQILSAPTRKEVDAAHARRTWLAIGVPSLRNLFYIDRKRSFLWILLGVSSMPLHLLWNSAVIDDLSKTFYLYNAVTEDFLGGMPWNSTSFLTPYSAAAGELLAKFNNDSLVNMTTSECMRTYRTDAPFQYGNLILVYDVEGYDDSLLAQSTFVHSTLNPVEGEWMCGSIESGSACRFDQLIQENATHWNPWNNTGRDIREYRSENPFVFDTGFHIEGNVKYCLAENANSRCRLAVVSSILVTVLVCNAVKLTCFILTLWVGGSMQPLVTNGDAIESFLQQPDTSFEGRCLVSKPSAKTETRFWCDNPQPLRWGGNRQRWAAGATRRRWIATLMPYELLCHFVKEFYFG